MDSEGRHSEAREVELITDSELVARREAENGIRQFNAAIEQIEYWLHPERPFRLRPSAILELNRLALEGISRDAGRYRPAEVEITGSKHKPAPAFRVPELVEHLCDYVNENWKSSPIHLASYVMWRAELDPPFCRWKWPNDASDFLHRSLREVRVSLARHKYDTGANLSK